MRIFKVVIFIMFLINSYVYSEWQSKLMAYVGLHNGIVKIDAEKMEIVKKVVQIPCKEFRWITEIELSSNGEDLFVVSNPAGRPMDEWRQEILVAGIDNFTVPEDGRIDICPPEARNKGFSVRGIKASPNGKKLYVSVSYLNEKEDDSIQKIYVIDTDPFSESRYKVIKEIKGYFDTGRKAAQFSNNGKLLYLADKSNNVLRIINTETDEVIEERKNIFDRNNLFKILNEKDKIFMYGLYVFKEVGLHFFPKFNTRTYEYSDAVLKIVNFNKKIEKIDIPIEYVKKYGNDIGSVTFTPDRQKIWISFAKGGRGEGGSGILIVDVELKKVIKEIENIGDNAVNIVFNYERVKVDGKEGNKKETKPVYMGTKEVIPVKKKK